MPKSSNLNVIPSDDSSISEISLIDLFWILWNKKVSILLVTLVFIVVSVAYAFLAKERWTSNATVIAPRTTELGNLLPLRAEYARVIGDTKFTPTALAKSLHYNFRHFLLSDDLKRDFIAQSSWIKKQLEGKNEQQQRQFISEFINKDLAIHKPDNKKKDETELEEVGLKLSFSAETPEYAQDVLNQYIDFVNAYVINEINREFKIGFHLRLDNLKFNKTQIVSNINESNVIQVENLANALEVAKKAGIKEFSKNTSSTNNSLVMPEYLSGDAKLNISDSKLADGTYLFMLGEKYLQAQLDIAKDKGMVYPLDYYKIDRELIQLEPLIPKLDGISGVKTYRYLASPDYPAFKDHPKRILILLIGTILGLIIGCIYALILNIFERYKLKNS